MSNRSTVRFRIDVDELRRLRAERRGTEAEMLDRLVATAVECLKGSLRSGGGDEVGIVLTPGEERVADQCFESWQTALAQLPNALRARLVPGPFGTRLHLKLR